MPERDEFSKRERMFVSEYLVDLNATQAAVRAGYSPRSAPHHAHRVLNRPRVKAAIEAAMAARERKLEITAEQVLREIALLGFANVMDYFTPQADGTACVDLSRLTRGQAAAITEVTVEEFVSGRGAAGREVKRVKVKLADKSRNLELVGKHLGMFARKPGEENANGEKGNGGDVELSDEERAQEILRLLAAGRTARH
jgi:phage terminase small subunit